MKVDHRSWRPAASAAAIAAVLAVAAAPAARAQGFGLNEIGSCSVARTGAGVASPCKDASALFWNPAAAATMLDTTRWSLLVGVAPISVNGSFTADTTLRRDEADVATEFPPHLFANYAGRLNRWGVHRFGVGLGVYVPYGLTTEWADDFPGRFAAQKASLQTVYIQPTLSVELVPNRLSVGAGPILGHSKIELIQSLDLAAQAVPNGGGATLGQVGIPPRTEFARFSGTGDAWAGGFHVGVQGQLTASLSLGARLMSALFFEYEGDGSFTQVATGLTLPANNPLAPGSTTPLPVDVAAARFFDASQGGVLVEQEIASVIKHPAQLQVGVAFTGFERTVLNFDYNFTTWSDFEELPVTFRGPAASRSRVIIEDYDDSHSFRTSVEHLFAGSTAAPFLNGVTGRAGFNYVKSPAPDLTVTPLLPDMDRYNFAVGAGIPLGDRLGVDVSYLRVETPGRRGRLVEREREETDLARLNSGWYELTANVLSISLKASF